MSDPLPSASPCQDPPTSQSPEILPSRLDGQRLAQACLEAIHLLDQMRGPHLHVDHRQLRDRVLLRLTYCVLHSDRNCDQLHVLGIHRECLERLRILPSPPILSGS